MDGDFFAAEFMHYFFYAVLGGIVFEGFVNVRVGRSVAANEAAEPRDDPFQVTKINPSPRREGGFAKIEHEHFAAGLGEAMHFAQAVFKTGEVTQAEGDCNAIKMVIGQAGFQRVAFAKGDGEVAIAAISLVEHRFAEIEAGDVRAVPRQREGDVAGAAAKVERALARTRIGKGNETLFPAAMEPKTLKIIDEIVARGNGVKEVAHALSAGCVIGKIASAHGGGR